MPSPLVPNAALVEIRCTLRNLPVENTLWFRRLSGSIDEENLKDLCAYVRGWFFSSILPLLPVGLTFREVYAKGRDIVDGYEGSDAIGTGTTGSLQITSEPSNVSLAVSFRTGRTGRSRRGRNYWLALPDDQVNENTVADDYIGEIILAYQDLVGPTAAGWTWCVASLRTGNNWRDVGLTTDITSVVVVDATVDSQRGRLS